MPEMFLLRHFPIIPVSMELAELIGYATERLERHAWPLASNTGYADADGPGAELVVSRNAASEFARYFFQDSELARLRNWSPAVAKLMLIRAGCKTDPNAHSQIHSLFRVLHGSIALAYRGPRKEERILQRKNGVVTLKNDTPHQMSNPFQEWAVLAMISFHISDAASRIPFPG